jgi:MFS family permease
MKMSSLRERLRAPYTVMVLILAYTFSFIDRQILSLLVEPIKHDLSLNDTQISLLQGLAFAVFMGLGGLPIGRLIDRYHRIRIIAVGVAFWSVMTVCCGLAKNYTGLLLSRMGVGLGESTLTPAAYSVISDSVPPKRLGLALGAYSMGVYIGAGLALIIGAAVIAQLPVSEWIVVPLLGEMRPWQLVFVVVGLPGLLVALLVLTITEPARHLDGEKTHYASLAQVKQYLFAHRVALGLLILCHSFAAMSSYTLNAWAPSFFVRTYGWSLADTGYAFGITIVLSGMTGVVAGGLIGDYLLTRRVHSGRVKLMGSAMLVAAPLAFLAPLMVNPYLSLLLLGGVTFLITLTIGTGPAAMQEVLPSRMRGTVNALAVLIVNLIGLGIGPTCVGLLTDYAFVDANKLNYALAISLPCMMLLSVLFSVLSLKPYQACYQQRRTEERLSK